MDTTDKTILDLLQRDASLALSEIATRVHLSPTACWKRIQKLESAG
ncbi:MAG: AsnC family transcriptional regulator, partial [Burkholderiaceae bacterium]|nr:AsnC family transcriptional regulator [Burkholderiaceae bacterium]